MSMESGIQVMHGLYSLPQSPEQKLLKPQLYSDDSHSRHFVRNVYIEDASFSHQIQFNLMVTL